MNEYAAENPEISSVREIARSASAADRWHRIVRRRWRRRRKQSKGLRWIEVVDHISVPSGLHRPRTTHNYRKDQTD